MDSYTERMNVTLSDHTITRISSGTIRSFYFHDGSRIGGVLISDTPEGLALQGDWVPARHGVVSAYGYGIPWFGSDLSEEYLCSKFLETQFVREVAVEQLRDTDGHLHRTVEHDAVDATHDDLTDWADELEGGYIGQDELATRLMDNRFEVEDMPGVTYDPDDAARLCIIQQAFADAFQAWLKTHDLEEQSVDLNDQDETVPETPGTTIPS